MDALRTKRGFICDMDGVIYHGSRLLEGSKTFLGWLKDEGKQFRFLTNSSARSPRRLHQKLMHMGIESGIDTVLFLSGITKQPELDRYPYGPHYILRDVSEIRGGPVQPS
jgi:NagD protein